MPEDQPREWIDLAQRWDSLHAAAEKREASKAGLPSARPWAVETHFYGLLGEAVYAATTKQRVNRRTLKGGDGGEDFADGVDVKTATFYVDPWLKVETAPANGWPRGGYALVALDLSRRMGYLAGRWSVDEVQRAGLRDWGHGKMRSLQGAGAPPRPEPVYAPAPPVPAPAPALALRGEATLGCSCTTGDCEDWRTKR